MGGHAGQAHPAALNLDEAHLDDLGIDATTTAPANSQARPTAAHQLPMPPQQRRGHHQERRPTNGRPVQEVSQMSRAGEIMHRGAECIGPNDTLETAARKMRDLQIGALPICGSDGNLIGIITDRDIVVRGLTEGRDARKVPAGKIGQREPVWIDASAAEDEVLRLMEENGIRRLPVMENSRLVGMISEADLAAHLNEHKLAEFVETICSAAPTAA
jgi:CBS domain-containing protein